MNKGVPAVSADSNGRCRVVVRLLAVVSLSACGNVLLPERPEAGDVASDRAADATDRDAPSDARVSTDAHIDAGGDASVGEDASVRPDGAGLPSARLVVVEASPSRSLLSESLTAYRVDPRAGGSIATTTSGPCVVENTVQPAYGSFADAVSLITVGRESVAQRRPDQALVWRAMAEDIIEPSMTALVNVRRAGWPSVWTTPLQFPTSVQVLEPAVAPLVIPTDATIDVRWESMGHWDDVVVELIFERYFFRSDTRNWDLSTIRCAFEAWRERGSVTPSAHPAFRQPVGASDGIVFNVDTVRRSIRQFPDGERVLVEERSNSYSSPVTYRR
jgi:hypothetical protein